MKVFNVINIVFMHGMVFSWLSISGMQMQNRKPYLLRKETIKAGAIACAKVSGLTFFGAIMGGNIAAEIAKNASHYQVNFDFKEALFLEKIAHGALVGAAAGLICSSQSLAIIAHAAWQDTKRAGRAVSQCCRR